MEAYQQMGIAAEAVEQGMMGKGVNFIVKGEKVRRIDLESMGKGLSPFPYIHMLEQSKNEALLNSFLEVNGGGVLWNTSLDTFVEDEDGITATLNHKDGEILTIKADWLIGADGASSLVRKQIGMTFKGDTYDTATIQQLTNYFKLAKIHVLLHPLPKEIYSTLFEDLGINEKALFIIRPDMYIGYRSSVVDLADLEIYFEQHLTLL